ncbi:TonB-dependent receptor [Iodidimonas gelatinilytica]|uniref:TonB-dependent receptor n=2 Tax=Iodidimonas gelatinilytica TaxID=1236966 RepID=A0A5A7MZ20_9PROT|nr:TonB-dependent receptor [Iodidimonas gelatinilytica]
MAQSDEGVDEIEQIVVTGSRIARRDLTSSSPVAVVDAEQYRLSGTVNVEQLLNTLPQVIPGTTAFSNNPGNGAATLDLRGLGAERTLILVNNRRYMFFDANQITDVNTIPAALVERTEVVTGGASAVYGSDAIGGVVNFILKDDFEGIEIGTQYDITTRGDADRANIDLTMGGNFADGRGNAVLYMNYFDRDAVMQDARDFSFNALLDDFDENGNPALVPGGSASVLNGRFSGPLDNDVNRALRPGLTTALDNAGLTGLGGLGFLPGADGQTATNFRNPEDLFNYAPDNFLQIPQERWMIGTMATYDITDQMEFYAEGSFANNRVITELAPTPITGNFLFNVDSPFLSPAMQEVLRQADLTEGTITGTVRDDNGNLVNPGTLTLADTAGDGQTSLSIGRRLEEVGPRQNSDERNSWRVVTGIRGDLGDFSDTMFKNMRYDAYYMFARTLNTQRQAGNVSRSAFQAALLDNSLNIFGPNITEDAADSIRIAATNVEESQLQVASGAISGDIIELPAGPVGGAFGFEWRSTSARFSPDTALSSGDVVGFNAGNPTAGGYDVWELFGEVRVPIVADLPFAKNVEVNGAFRYSDYDLENVGGVWTYAGGVDWSVSDDLMFRGQFQRAVRAPNVQELFGGQAQGFPGAIDPCSDQFTGEQTQALRDTCIASGVPAANVFGAIQPNTQIQGLFGGNPDLEEETSDTFTIGAVITPQAIPGLSVTIDYYNIEVDDAISVLGGSLNNVLDLCFNEIQDINSPFCQAVNRNPGGDIGEPNFVEVLNANIGKFETDGIDLQINYSMDLDFGLLSESSSLDFFVLGTWVNNFDITPVAAIPERIDECAGTFGNTCGEPLPEFKTNSRVTWRTGPLNLSLRWRWIDSVKDDQLLNEGTVAANLAVPKIGSQNYFDLSATFDVLDNVQIFGGVDNLFDNKPPLVADSSEQANTFPGTYDVLGSRLFFGATVRF